MVSITHLLNKSVTLKRKSVTPDGQGGFTNALTTVDSLMGRRQAATAKERTLAGREEGEVSHVWYFDKGVTVLPRDVLVFGTEQDEVIGHLDPSVPDFVKVAVKEIQLGATS